MPNTNHDRTFSVNGYEVSATFADVRNTSAIGQVKQILLSSFTNTAKTHNESILAFQSEPRDNEGGATRHVP